MDTAITQSEQRQIALDVLRGHHPSGGPLAVLNVNISAVGILWWLARSDEHTPMAKRFEAGVSPPATVLDEYGLTTAGLEYIRYMDECGDSLEYIADEIGATNWCDPSIITDD